MSPEPRSAGLDRRIVVHDYAGHPFQIQLSRELARRGNSVLHIHFAQAQTPKGPVAVRAGDPSTLAIKGISIDRPYQKHNFVRRRFQELEYGRRVARAILSFRPHVLLSANSPLEVQREIFTAGHAVGSRLIFWVQDIQSAAIRQLLPKKWPVAGPPIGYYFDRLERRLAEKSDHLVFISERARELFLSWGVAEERCHIIENWAPVDEIQPLSRDNDWSRAHGFVDKRVLLYTGTLGMKHNPSLLVRLAQHVSDRPDTVLVVVSEGLGANWLKAEIAAKDIRNLRALPYQDYNDLAQVIATAELTLAILEPTTADFAVPSKVYSYMAAGRPLVLAVPPENQAAQAVAAAGAGLVVHPRDPTGFLAAADRMLGDELLRMRCGAHARAYAEANFDIDRIADRFETLWRPVEVARVPAIAEGARALGSQR